MSIRNAILIFCAVFSFQASFAQDNENLYVKVKSAFAKEWKQFDSLGIEDLPNEQLAILDQLIEKSLQQRNAPEYYRALQQYPFVIERTLEDPEVKHEILAAFENRTEQLDAPFSNILHAFLAKQFHDHAYQWEVMSWGGEDFSIPCKVNGKVVYFTRNLEDQKLIKEYHLNQSLNRPEALQQPSIDFANSLHTDSSSYVKLPTLYDLLGENYLNYFSSNYDRSIAFDLNWFGRTEDFASNSSTEALKVYRELELFHWKNKNLDAYTHRVLSRLDYVLMIAKRNAITNDAAYLDALQWLKSRLNGHPSTLGVICRETEMKLYAEENQYNYKSNPKAVDLRGMLHDQMVNGLKQFPGSIYASEAQEIVNAIESKAVQVYSDKPYSLGRDNVMTVEYQNVSQAYLTIYHIDSELDADDWRANPFRMLKLSKVHAQALNFDMKGRYNLHTKDFIIPDLKKTGRYLFLLTSTKDSADVVVNLEELQQSSLSYALIDVHQFEVIHKQSVSNMEIVALDSRSGKPVAGAMVYGALNGQPKYQFMGKTDKLGEFRSGLEGGVRFKVVYQKDSILDYVDSYYYDADAAANAGQYKYRFLSDRMIYRPGQTVYFKFYAFQGNSPEFSASPNHAVKIQFGDEQGSELGTVEGKTNEFGTFAGSFPLPKSGRTGMIYLNVNGQYIGAVRVEEYKRPSFEVEAKYDKTTYKIGDRVTVSGKAKAYSGYGLANSKVHVKITYAQPYKYIYGGGNQGNVLDTVVTSNAMGDFSVSFTAKTKDNDRFGASFSYEVSATSEAGETQRTFGSIFIGNQRTEWLITMPNKVLSNEKAYAHIAVTGDEQNPVKKQLEVELWRKNSKFKESDLVFQQHEFQDFTLAEFNKKFDDATYGENAGNAFEKASAFTIKSGDSLEIGQLVGNMAGHYELRLTSRSSLDTITEIRAFDYIRIDTKKNQHQAPLWAAATSEKMKPGEEITVLIGSKYKKLNVLVEFYRGEQLISHEWMKLKKRKKLSYKVQPQDLGGISIHVFAMYNGDLLQSTADINVPYDSKKLDVKLETMRDILRPGTQEKWVVSVTTPDGSPLSSELVAGMFDASLDQFATNDWDMLLYANNFTYPKWQANWRQNLYFMQSGSWVRHYTTGFIRGYADGHFGTEGSFKNMDVTTSRAELNSAPVMVELEESNVAGGVVSGKDAKVPAKEEKVRSNFNETAFFYPQLTAKDNRMQFEFTLPDALTRWKFQALAHDKLMRFGYTAKEFTAQKELMVDPNEPRFFRAGDEFVFAVNLVNLTDKAQDVTATLEWFDPFTNVVIPNVLGAMPNQQVKLDAKGMQTVNWTLKIPKTGLDLIAYRVKANSGQFSDGEEKVIPILSNRTQVIESVPIALEGKGNYTFELPKLIRQTSATQRNEKLVLEYNANPLWSAVMAIPYITEYPYDCAEQVFSKYFASQISREILAKNPIIEKVLSQAGNDPDRFRSALETNEDLKAILLAETPWVLEAKSEAEQKRRISELFEMNNILDRQRTQLNKLEQMKNPDGGWSWFAGGTSNLYITQHILSGFGHLSSLGLDEGKLDLDGPLEFVEKYHEKQYKMLKKEQLEKHEGLSALEIQWLYLRKMLGLESTETSDYYSKCLERDWAKYPLHVQAMAGVYFVQTENAEMSQKIFKSIKSKATVRKNYGTYWNENKNAYSWDRNAIETQASLIEFFQKMKADEKLLSSMKLWLLNQKRGQYWESTKTTAWACYALLIDAKEVANGNFTEKIYLGDQEIEGSATGYVRKTFSATEIKPSMGRVTVNQGAEEPAFGSLNLVYTEEMDKVSSNASGMQIVKQIYLVKDGKEILVTPTTKLVLGDLLRVKLQIVSDRDLEFVHVKDLRASGTENVETLSAYRSSGSLYFYNANRDASTEFFLDNLPKGKHTISYDQRVSGKGLQSTGYALVECLYAPEFRANSSAGTLKVE